MKPTSSNQTHHGSKGGLPPDRSMPTCTSAAACPKARTKSSVQHQVHGENWNILVEVKAHLEPNLVVSLTFFSFLFEQFQNVSPFLGGSLFTNFLFSSYLHLLLLTSSHQAAALSPTSGSTCAARIRRRSCLASSALEVSAQARARATQSRAEGARPRPGGKATPGGWWCCWGYTVGASSETECCLENIM